MSPPASTRFDESLIAGSLPFLGSTPNLKSFTIEASSVDIAYTSSVHVIINSPPAPSMFCTVIAYSAGASGSLFTVNSINETTSP